MRKRYDAFEDVANMFRQEYYNFDSKLFEKNVKSAIRLADKSLDFRLKILSKTQIRKKSETEISRQLVKDILVDKLIFKDKSYLDNMISGKYQDFDVFQYNVRTEEFMKKYGDEIQSFGSKKRTLSEWLLRFSEGKIKKRTMNSIISRFKSTTEYLKHKEGSK